MATKTGRGRPKKSAVQERKTRGSTIPSAATYRNDLQRRFLAEHSVAMLEQCCSYSKQCCNNVVTLCCVKNRRCESSRSRVTSPLDRIGAPNENIVQNTKHSIVERILVFKR